MPWICGRCKGRSEIYGYVKHGKIATMFRECQNCGFIVASHNLTIPGIGQLRGIDLSNVPMFKNFVESFDTKKLMTFGWSKEAS